VLPLVTAWMHREACVALESEQLSDDVVLWVARNPEAGLVTLLKLVVLPDLDVHSRSSPEALIACQLIEPLPKVADLQTGRLGASRTGDC
jgi:hypothetical protein